MRAWNELCLLFAAGRWNPWVPSKIRSMSRLQTMHTQGKQYREIKTRYTKTRMLRKWHAAICIIFRFGEKMSDVKKDNDRRTARLQIDRNSASNGLVTTTNKFVSSRNKMIASAASSHHHHSSARQQQSSNPEFNRYNHTSSSHGSTHQNPHNRPQPPPPHHGLLPGSHPMLDRSKHKKHNPEIMKRTLRYNFSRLGDDFDL